MNKHEFETMVELETIAFASLFVIMCAVMVGVVLLLVFARP
jgi:hypothetical protein